MYRFQVSKYKNAAPKIPKKEFWITEIPCGQVMGSCGDFVTVSANHIAFNVESGGGGCAGILPLDATGRCNRKVPTIYAHSEFLTDMCFSPFDDDLLATCSYDGKIKLWDISLDFGETLDKPLIDFTPDEVQRKLDILRFHPNADEILSCTALDAVNIIDLNVCTTKYCILNGTESQYQSTCWKFDGTVLVTSCKDTVNRIVDPRKEAVSLEFDGFQGNKDSRLVWLGSTDYIFGTGFTKTRKRQMGIWDIRKPTSLIFDEELDTGSGCLMPFHDIDTNMIIVAGKGDNFVSLYEFSEATKSVSLSSVERMAQQTFGMGATPKRVLDVMNGEVNRMYQLSKNTITKMPYIIPRKSYKEFHADLFPDSVYSGKPSSNAKDWFEGIDKEPIKVSLDPKTATAKQPIVSGLKVRKLSESTADNKQESSNKEEKKEIVNQGSNMNGNRNEEKELKDVPKRVVPVHANQKSKFMGQFQSKFKHILGETQHKSHNIENIKNLSDSLPSESDGFQVYSDFVVVPLAGAGGRLAVFKLSKPGRLPESEIPVLQNGSGVMDFSVDPFTNSRVAVACEDWSIKIWNIPDEGLEETMTHPTQVLMGHKQRATIVKFHPTASNILVSASMDFSIIVWDLTDGSEIGSLEGHTDQILSVVWHPNGKYLATFCRDKKIRIYDPVEDLEPMKVAEGPLVTRGARMCWCGPENMWLVLASSTGSGRCLYLFNEELKEVQFHELEDSSPSVLSLHYDESTSVLFATGKGDRTIYAFEVNTNEPFFHPLSSTNFKGVHQGISLLEKRLVDVKKVEIAKAARLTKTSIELVSFTIPRIKTEYFQDDIYGDVLVTWKPCLTAENWLDGDGTLPNRISLKPKDMKNLSDAPVEAPKASKYDSSKILSEKTDEEKKAELLDAMMGTINMDSKLEQDDFEGVDEDEWDD